MAESELVQTTPKVQLTLSFEEAVALKVILDRVGGDPDHSPRGYINSIANALEDVGVSAESVDKPSIIGDSMRDNSIYFRDYSLPDFLKQVKNILEKL